MIVLGGWEEVVAAAAATTVLPLPPTPPPPPPPLPMPEVEPLPELTVLREFWLPCGVRFPISSVRLGAWVLLWWEDAGDGGTSPSAFTRDGRRQETKPHWTWEENWMRPDMTTDTASGQRASPTNSTDLSGAGDEPKTCSMYLDVSSQFSFPLQLLQEGASYRRRSGAGGDL